jgi:hypothetical protein
MKRLTFLSCNDFTGMPIDVQHNASQVGGDDDSDWFHRNDAYQMQPKPGGTTHILIAQSNNVATGSITQLSGSIITCIMYYNIIQTSFNYHVQYALQSHVQLFLVFR